MTNVLELDSVPNAKGTIQLLYFQALVTQGATQALICQSYYSTPTLTSILLTFNRLPWNDDCRAYLGLTNVCFIPPVSETRLCPALAADTTFVRQACNDQTYLKTRLVMTCKNLN